MCSLHFEKGIKGDIVNVFDSKPYLMTYHWKGLLTIKIRTLRKGSYDIHDQNGGLPKLISKGRYHFGQRCRRKCPFSDLVDHLSNDRLQDGVLLKLKF